MPGLPAGLTPTLPQLHNLISGLPISALPISADIPQPSVITSQKDKDPKVNDDTSREMTREDNSDTVVVDTSLNTTSTCNTEASIATNSSIVSPSQQSISMVMTPSFQTGVQSSVPNFPALSPALLPPMTGTVPLLTGLNLFPYPTVQSSAVKAQPNTQTMQAVAHQMFQTGPHQAAVSSTLQESNVAKLLSQVSCALKAITCYHHAMWKAQSDFANS